MFEPATDPVTPAPAGSRRRTRSTAAFRLATPLSLILIVIYMAQSLLPIRAASAQSRLPSAPPRITATTTHLPQTLVRWTRSPSATGYRVYRNRHLLARRIRTTRFMDRHARRGTWNRYFVRACNRYGCSAPSRVASVWVRQGGHSVHRGKPILSPPNGLFAFADHTSQVRLSWDASSAGPSYNVYRDGTLLAKGLRATHFADSTAPAGIEHSYAVASCSSRRCSQTGQPVQTIVPPPATCTGVEVNPGMDLAALVAQSPEGTTFCLDAGVYALESRIQVKDSDSIIGTQGAVLDGQGTTDYGIYGYGGPDGLNNVMLAGLTLQNFRAAAVWEGWYWTVQDVEIRDSQVGISVSTGSVLRNSFIHDNRQYGIIGGPGRDIRVETTELTSNNTSRFCGGACEGDAGTDKIVGSMSGAYGVVWRGNWVHDNIGNGIWSDGNVRDSLYANNLVENNTGSGIFHEISWDATIRDNVLRNNAYPFIGHSCWWGSQIEVNNSQRVDISGNDVVATNGVNGICVVNSTRSEPSPFPTALAQVSVHQNTIQVGGPSATGCVGDRPAANVSFDANSYVLSDLSTHNWSWWGQYPLTWPDFRGHNQETHGSRMLVAE
jgi:parallel beta-helix repeat protein